MYSLRPGDYVIYTTNVYSDSEYNPLWGGSQGCIYGRVTSMLCDDVNVKWENGKSNGYRACALSIVIDKGLPNETHIPIDTIPELFLINKNDAYKLVRGKLTKTITKGNITDVTMGNKPTLDLPKDRIRGIFNV